MDTNDWLTKQRREITAVLGQITEHAKLAPAHPSWTPWIEDLQQRVEVMVSEIAAQVPVDTPSDAPVTRSEMEERLEVYGVLCAAQAQLMAANTPHEWMEVPIEVAWDRVMAAKESA